MPFEKGMKKVVWNISWAYLQFWSLSWIAPKIAGEGTSPSTCMTTIFIEIANGRNLGGTDHNEIAFDGAYKFQHFKNQAYFYDHTFILSNHKSCAPSPKIFCTWLKRVNKYSWSCKMSQQDTLEGEKNCVAIKFFIRAITCRFRRRSRFIPGKYSLHDVDTFIRDFYILKEHCTANSTCSNPRRICQTKFLYYLCWIRKTKCLEQVWMLTNGSSW